MLSLFVTEILIRIDQIQAPVFVQCLYHLIEGIGLQEIIMVREHQKLAGGHTDGSIGILGNTPIHLQAFQANAWIRTVSSLYESRGLSVGASVRQTKLKISVGLGCDRIDECLQKGLRRIIERHHNTDERLISKNFFSLPLQFFFVRRMETEPFLVFHRAILQGTKFPGSLGDEGLRAVGSPVA